ncbi:hypothetical protein OIU77_007807 [Salix suchowensis]|uniref:Uncharacterized protein n=1 Tax=Salix suchowensis TaxID=1278906 RepID=A0ABQ9AJJ1_9ROSI|nr:hypothetical protein OIU77_007807 [Salix suchowensis]
MAQKAPLITSAAYLRGLNRPHFLASKTHFGLQSPTRQLALAIVAMATQKKVNKYDGNWKKQWYGAGIFYENSEEVEVDVFKKLEKPEELGLLSLLEKTVSVSPSILASAALPILVAAVVAIVVIPDDSAGLIAAQAVLAGALGVGAVALLVGSFVLDGLQEAD